jgi:hypothetical protein
MLKPTHPKHTANPDRTARESLSQPTAKTDTFVPPVICWEFKPEQYVNRVAGKFRGDSKFEWWLE